MTDTQDRQTPITHLSYIIHYIDADGNEGETEKLTVSELRNELAAMLLDGRDLDWTEAIEEK